MRIIKFLFFTTLTVGLVWVLDSSSLASWLANSISSKDQFLPPLGKLLSPSSGFWKNAESEQGPNMRKRLWDKSLGGPVMILYDDRMVPHVFAESTGDAFFAQGYVTASLRLWQMEFQTHAAAGRLTEFMGTTSELREKLLPIDRRERREGLPRAAKEMAEAWMKDDKIRPLLESYTRGVNAYISSLSYDELPIEYKILDYRPEPWSLYKSALLLKAMAKTLVKKDQDFPKTNAYKKLGKKKFASLYPDYFQEQLPIVMDTSFYNFKVTEQLDSVTIDQLDSIASPYLSYNDLLDDDIEDPQKGIGSNNWAVGGKKTASGDPILCNDPHLSLNLPSIWFEIQIVTPDYNAYGASLPGAPGIISGFNEHIAWGVTNVSHDVRDWYAIKWKDANKTTYEVDGKTKDVKIIYDTIHVRGKDVVIDTLRYTEFGPIAHSQGGQDYALRWLANDVSYEPRTFIQLLEAKDYQDYREAIEYFHCPPQNLVFACEDGDIALWTQGHLPLRRPNHGKFVMDGSVSFDQWQGFIPQEHIPHEYNPAKGFVASANQHSVSPEYPYNTYGYFEEYRGRFLNTQLAAMANVDAEKMKELQLSNFGQKAKDFLPLMLEYLNTGRLEKEELELLAQLKDWEYNYETDQVAATIFEDWFYNLRVMVYDELLKLKRSNDPDIKPEIVLPDEWHLLSVLKRDTGNFVIDIEKTPEKENVEDMMVLSFKETYKTVPKDSSGKVYSWASMKSTTLYHLARIKQFSFFDVPVPGTASALNAIKNRYDFEKSHEQGKPVYRNESTAGPSWRMIVELGDNPRAHAIYPGGQSGNPGSRFYANMLQDWVDGKYNSVLYLKDQDTESEKIIFRQNLRN